MGVREIVSGIGVLAQSRPRVRFWARVAGDVLALALIGKKLGQRDPRKARIVGAAVMVLTLGALDYLYARKLTVPSVDDV